MIRLLLAIVLSLICASTAEATNINCDDIDPTAVKVGPKRAVQAEDIIRLRDIGWSGSPDAPLTLSPDGRHIAFALRRADITHNGYCFAMIVLDLDGNGAWRRIDTGGEIIGNKVEFRGRVLNFPNGVVESPIAKWSPDGRWIAYLRREEGVTQVWRVAMTGGPATPIIKRPLDVEDFAWSDDRTLVFSERPALAASKAAIDAEAARGFHYDDRFAPHETNRPIVHDDGEPVIQRIDLETGRISAALPTDAHLLSGATAADADAVAPGSMRGLSVKIAPTDPTRVFAADTLSLSDKHGVQLPCLGPDCIGRFAGEWWDKDGRLYFLKYDGWARNRSSLYRWTRSNPTPQQILSTEDLLASCLKVQTHLVCAAEGSLQPRHIISIDLRTGKTRTLYEPNPEFAGLDLHPARRLFWKNSFGIETFGDLVLPAGYKQGTKLPLVVVQYTSRGFLRGGTGDDVPIQLLAQAGFAVLSFQRPRDIGMLAPARAPEDIDRINSHDVIDRRSVQSSLETGIKMLVDQGIVDPKRMGLSGLSDGSATVEFELINSKIFFAAVAEAQCCEEDINHGLVGPMISARNRDAGFPPIGDRDDSFWDRKSIVRAASRIDTPMLVQVSDSEYLVSLVPWAALRTYGKPIDMFVFPNEYHVKAQPAHRLAFYNRYLAWFAFWLQDRRTDLTDSADLDRWQAWKDQLHKTSQVTHLK